MQGLEGGAQPAGALVGVERHPEPAFERPSDQRRFEAALPQLFIAEPGIGLCEDVLVKTGDLLRIGPMRELRLSYATRQISAMQRFLNGTHVLDFLRFRSASRSGRPADDPGGTDAGEENPFDPRVLPEERIIHFARG